jgi:hypothetical protein
MGFRGVLGICLALAISAPSFGVTQYKTKRSPFLFDITTFTTTLSLPVKDDIETVRMSDATMRERLDKSADDETIEPLTVMLASDDAQIAAMAEKIAINGKEDELSAYLQRQLRQAKPVKKGASIKTVTIDETAYDLVDKEAFADLYSKPHHNLTVDTTLLKKDRTLRREFMRQIGPFFTKDERKQIQEKVNKGAALDVDTELLPEFPRKMVKKYILYRGPNCFHAALAFHSPKLTSSSLINVKDEVGYHRAMINYDELWRVLNTNFYEINPDKQALKYGDMLVFFDVPEDAADDADVPVDFRWIRHAATYLFGGYTFSKGSKSPNTPYTVRTLAEEWKTWKRYTANLGVKVYRRSTRAIKTRPPVDLTDWIY